MASVTIQIPDQLVPRVEAAMRAKFPEYNDLAAGPAFKRVTADYWRQVVREHEVDQLRTEKVTQLDTELKAAGEQMNADLSGIA